MVAVDTNLVVRLLTGDDAQQASKAREIIEHHEVFIPDSVVLETEWVLRFAYEFPGAAIREALTKLFGLKNVHLSDPALIAQAITWHNQGLDFADALHLASSSHCDSLHTFDVAFVRRAKGLTKCAVVKP